VPGEHANVGDSGKEPHEPGNSRNVDGNAVEADAQIFDNALDVESQVSGETAKPRYSCELPYRLKPNTHRRRRRNSTVELSCVGGVY